MQVNTLEQICNDYQIDINKVIILKKEIVKWSKYINIVGINTLSDIDERHVLDSVQISNYISNDKKVIDIGTGAGFPGLILAFAGKMVTMVERDYKKYTFLKHILNLTSTHSDVLNCDAYTIFDQFDVITARGFSPLVNLLQIQKNVSRETICGIYLKGENYKREIEEAERQWLFEYMIEKSLTNPNSSIIIISNLSKKTK